MNVQWDLSKIDHLAIPPATRAYLLRKDYKAVKGAVSTIENNLKPHLEQPLMALGYKKEEIDHHMQHLCHEILLVSNHEGEIHKRISKSMTFYQKKRFTKEKIIPPFTVWIAKEQTSSMITLEIYTKSYIKKGSYKRVKKGVMVTLENDNKKITVAPTVIKRCISGGDWVATEKQIRHGIDLHCSAAVNATYKSKLPPLAQLRPYTGLSGAKKLELSEAWFNGDFAAVVEKGALPISAWDNTQIKRFSTIDKLNILINVAQTLHDMHCNGLVHLDVTPSNILVRISESGTAEGVISDFDLAITLNDCITAPELKRYVYHDESAHAGFKLPSCDVFGLVICASEIFFREVWQLLDPERRKSIFLGSKIMEMFSPYIDEKWQLVMTDLGYYSAGITRMAAAIKRRTFSDNPRTVVEFATSVNAVLQQEALAAGKQHQTTLLRLQKEITASAEMLSLLQEQVYRGFNLHAEIAKDSTLKNLLAKGDKDEKLFAISFFEQQPNLYISAQTLGKRLKRIRDNLGP